MSLPFVSSCPSLPGDLNQSWISIPAPEACEEGWVDIPKRSDELSQSFMLMNGSWQLVDDNSLTQIENGAQGYQRADEFESTILQSFLLDIGLKEAVFGPPDLLSGKEADHPLSWLIAIYLKSFGNYLKQTSFEKVFIPFSEKIQLMGLLFTPFDEKGEPKKFDSKCATAILLSGSFAPQEAYMTGIIEGYRKKGVQVLAFNYPGFGDNQLSGEPSPENLIAGSEAALHFLASKGVPDYRTILHGYSMGGFAAAILAAQYNTHLVLDRVCSSTELIAYSIMKCNFRCGEITSLAASKIVKYGVPFDLSSIQKVRRSIFVAQESDEESQKIGALPYVQMLKEGNLLISTQITLKWIAAQHFSSPSNTWTVNGRKLSQKLNERYSECAKNNEARKAWKLFIKGIKA